MVKDPGEIFHLPAIEEVVVEDPEYAWSRKWVILNTVATMFGSMAALVALVVAVIALKS